MDRQKNLEEKDLKRKHPEEVDESSFSSFLRPKTSYPNDLTPHRHIFPSCPLTLEPSFQDHVIISPRLGFSPSVEELLSTKLPTKPQVTVIDFMGLSSPPPPQEAVAVTVTDPPNSTSILNPPPSPRSSRRNPTQGLRQQGKSETITPPFPWATNKRAVVHDINYLMRNQIHTISGDVYCKRCDQKFKMEYNLMEKFREVWKFIAENKNAMHDRAADKWMNPMLPTCMHCGQENSVRPITQDVKKKSMNWLFLLLGQMLGCCTLGQLKYFCKHTKNHRTGAKDRVLYLTYLALCKQLYPQGPFDR
ncbi:hypothetical protein TanjilG_16776 [Lupinus angustifolius]|uniref:DUF7086 domain-containing protein n=1 Tax=Lupinus angustifolius TaxID=3871 RepID=A0A4P1R0A7_LUPAN|nr:PREDICTED: uncharacterized protein LOC109326529 [Lupinus angustifolius]OIV98449.1 hypothetical protein TanjilG_16776 [Lupinus angustifolius]